MKASSRASARRKETTRSTKIHVDLVCRKICERRLSADSQDLREPIRPLKHRGASKARREVESGIPREL